MRRRILIAVVLVAALSAGSWAVYQRYIRPETAAPVFYGNVDIREVALGFRVGGKIASMRAEEGDAVESGQLIATLDKRPFLDDVTLRKADIAQRKANLEQLEAGSRPEEIERARAEVKAREAALKNAQRIFERQQKLAQRNVASEQSFDEAQAAYESAQAELDVARQTLKLAEEGPRKEEIAAAKAALEAAHAQKQIAETALADTELAAPDDGIILTRAVEPGAIVAAGTTVYTLSLQKPVHVRAYVGEPQLGLIHPGAKVELVTDTRPDQPYTGQVGFVSPTAEFTPKSVETPELRADLVYRFRVVVENPDDALRQGMPVTVRLADESSAVVAKE